MIVGIIGGIGSGKTLTMTKLLFDDYKKGYDIFTNFGIKFEQFDKELEKHGVVNKLDNEFFENYAKSKFNIINSTVAIDEAHVFIDSRRAASPRNKVFSKFITQSRKRSVDLYYTTQDKSTFHFETSGQVDLRLRKLTDYIVFCSLYSINGKVFVVNEWYDNALLYIGRKVFHGNPYFSKYDTNEIIDISD